MRHRTAPPIRARPAASSRNWKRWSQRIRSSETRTTASAVARRMSCRVTKPVHSDTAQARNPAATTPLQRGPSRRLKFDTLSLIRSPSRPSTPPARPTRYWVAVMAVAARSPAVALGRSTITFSSPRAIGRARMPGRRKRTRTTAPIPAAGSLSRESIVRLRGGSATQCGVDGAVRQPQEAASCRRSAPSRTGPHGCSRSKAAATRGSKWRPVSRRISDHTSSGESAAR